MDVQELIDDIIAKRKQNFSMKIKKYPRNNLILSDISDCTRANVYGVLNHADRKMFDIDTMAKFDEGNFKEKKVIQELIELGFEVKLQAETVEIKGIGSVVIAKGKIDGKIRIPESRIDIPFEIKSMAYSTFQSIKTLDDFNKKPWLRKYLRQIKMYMFGNSIEQGFFILEHRNQWKLLPVYLDLGECEYILKGLEIAFKHIQVKTLPDRITYDQSICGMCPFIHVCLQDVINKPAELIDNKDFEDSLDRYHELKPTAKECDEIYKRIKGSMENVEKVIVNSRYLLQNIPSERTVYDYPDDIKKQYAVKKPVKRLVIQKLGNE